MNEVDHGGDQILTRKSAPVAVAITNSIIDNSIEVLRFCTRIVLGRTYEKHITASGIIVTLERNRVGDLIRFFLTRDQAVFARAGYADTLYRMVFGSLADWDRLVLAAKKGPAAELFGAYRWYGAEPRIIYHLDGEFFSLSAEDVTRIDDIVRPEF